MFRGGYIPSYHDGLYDSNPFGRSYGPFIPMTARGAYEDQPYRLAKLEELRRKKEMQRQRELEALRRKRAQEEEYIRRLHEAERQERIRRRQLGPTYNVVRGPDGCLYRVPIDYDDEYEEPLYSPPLKRNQSPTSVRGLDGRVYQVQQRQEDDCESTKSEYHTADEDSVDTQKMRNKAKNRTRPNARVEVNVTSSSNAKVDVSVSSTNGDDVDMKDATTNKPSGRLVTVVVEDVPEEEVEDETKSVWRNRRPGPGESWMEPIKPSIKA